MTKHETLHAFAEIFLCWCAIFFGIWAMPIDLIGKILIDIFTTAGFTVLGIAYFSYKQIIHVNIPFRKVLFWSGVVIGLLQIGIGFFLTIAFWQVTTINGEGVITYNNVIASGFSVVSIAVIWYVIHLIRNRNEYMTKQA